MRRDDLAIQVEVKVTSWVEEVKKMVEKAAQARSAADLMKAELDIHACCTHLAGEITGIVLVDILDDEPWIDGKVALFKSGQRKLRLVEDRTVTIRTASGVDCKVTTPYLAPRCGIRRKRREGAGVYPAFAALGISCRCTPMLISDLSRQVVESGSIKEAHEALARRGIDLDIKTVWTIARAFSVESCDARDKLLKAGTVTTGSFSGQRVVACVDGGRLRTRKPRRRGRKPKGKKRRRFDTPWQEPKQLVIYVINEQGISDRNILPVIDGTMGNADSLTALLVGYLRLLGVQDAAELVIIGDGARWIWERIGQIVAGVGIDPKKVKTIVDFYHAVGHLQKVADLRTGWSEKQRRRWVTIHRRLLRHGKVDEVIEAIERQCVGRNAVKIRTELKYFVKNKSRMRYAWFKRRRLPIGSGAVESSIRRVVNLRMKGPSIYWRVENAEGFLHLRSVFKSGSWDEEVLHTLEAQAVPEAA